MKQNYLVLTTEDNNHEYNIEVENDGHGTVKYTLLASNNDVWTEHTKGKKLSSFTDDGNNIILEKTLGKTIGYDILNELRILINFRTGWDKTADSKYRIVQDVSLTTM